MTLLSHIIHTYRLHRAKVAARILSRRAVKARRQSYRDFHDQMAAKAGIVIPWSGR